MLRETSRPSYAWPDFLAKLARLPLPTGQLAAAALFRRLYVLRRALVSATHAGAVWELRCAVREQLVAFLQREFPGRLPAPGCCWKEGSAPYYMRYPASSF